MNEIEIMTNITKQHNTSRKIDTTDPSCPERRHWNGILSSFNASTTHTHKHSCILVSSENSHQYSLITTLDYCFFCIFVDPFKQKTTVNQRTLINGFSSKLSFTCFPLNNRDARSLSHTHTIEVDRRIIFQSNCFAILSNRKYDCLSPPCSPPV